MVGSMVSGSEAMQAVMTTGSAAGSSATGSSAASVSLPQSIGISVSAPQMQAPTIDIQA